MAGLNWIRAPTTLLPLVWSFVSWIAIFIPELELHTCAKKKGWRKVFHGSLFSTQKLHKVHSFLAQKWSFFDACGFHDYQCIFFLSFQFGSLPTSPIWVNSCKVKPQVHFRTWTFITFCPWHTVWKFQDFPITQILREINF